MRVVAVVSLVLVLATGCSLSLPWTETETEAAGPDVEASGPRDVAVERELTDEQAAEDPPAVPEADGSPDDPLAFGETALIADWEVTVTGFDVDATDAVLAEDETNEPPSLDRYVLVWVNATYRGTGERSAYLDLIAGVVEEEGAPMAFTDVGCTALTPNDLVGEPDAAAGETVSGSLCIDTYPSVVEGGFGLFLTSTDPEDRPVFWAVP